MTEVEKLEGDFEIAKFMGYDYDFVSNEVYATSHDTLHNYSEKWDLLVPAYNKCWKVVDAIMHSDLRFDLAKDEHFLVAMAALKTTMGVSDVNYQVNISSAWWKVTDFVKWYHRSLYPQLLARQKQNQQAPK